MASRWKLNFPWTPPNYLKNSALTALLKVSTASPNTEHHASLHGLKIFLEDLAQRKTALTCLPNGTPAKRLSDHRADGCVLFRCAAYCFIWWRKAMNCIPSSKNKIVMNIKSAIKVLDEFLLKDELPVDVMQESLQVIAMSPFSKHLTLAGVTDWRNKKPDQACLLRLRVLFQDEPTPSDHLLAKLSGLCALYGRIRAYLRNPSDVSLFEDEYNRIRESNRSDEVGLLCFPLTLKLAMYGTPEVSRLDIIEACLTVLDKIEQHWHSILS